MKKQFIVAIVASSVLANGASVAFAAKVSDSGNSDLTTITVEYPNDGNEAADEKRAEEQKVANQKKINQQKVANQKKINQQKVAIKKKISEQKTRLTTVLKAKKARDAILAIFKTAMADANKTRYAALKFAKTDPERKATIDAFNNAVAAASQVKTMALKALTASQTGATAKP